MPQRQHRRVSVQRASLSLREISALVRANLLHGLGGVTVKRKKLFTVPFDDRLKRSAREYVQIANLTGFSASWTGEENTAPLIMSADHGSLLVS